MKTISDIYNELPIETRHLARIIMNQHDVRNISILKKGLKTDYERRRNSLTEWAKNIQSVIDKDIKEVLQAAEIQEEEK